MSEFPLFGKCEYCAGEDYPLTMWRGKAWCKPCLVVAKDEIRSKIKAIEKPVDDFNKLIRRTQ